MKPLIAAVRKQLRVRTGEVECGFREKSDMLVKRSDVERFLDKKVRCAYGMVREELISGVSSGIGIPRRRCSSMADIDHLHCQQTHHGYCVSRIESLIVSLRV
jgi:hypothetical protein